MSELARNRMRRRVWGMATKTRGKNEGCIHQRKEDGLWLGKISLGYDANGKRLRKTVYGKTRREVAEKLKKLLRDQQQGLPITTDERQTLAQYLEDWLKTRRHLSENVHVVYESHLERHI